MTPFRFMCFIFLCVYEYVSIYKEISLAAVCDERNLAFCSFLFTSCPPCIQNRILSRKPWPSVTPRVAYWENSEERGPWGRGEMGVDPWSGWLTTVRLFHGHFCILFIPPIFYLAPSTAYDALLPPCTHPSHHLQSLPFQLFIPLILFGMHWWCAFIHAKRSPAQISKETFFLWVRQRKNGNRDDGSCSVCLCVCMQASTFTHEQHNTGKRRTWYLCMNWDGT